MFVLFRPSMSGNKLDSRRTSGVHVQSYERILQFDHLKPPILTDISSSIAFILKSKHLNRHPHPHHVVQIYSRLLILSKYFE